MFRSVGPICLTNNIGARIVSVFWHPIHSPVLKMKIRLIQKFCCNATDFCHVWLTFSKKAPRQSTFVKSCVKIHVRFTLQYNTSGRPGPGKSKRVNTHMVVWFMLRTCPTNRLSRQIVACMKTAAYKKKH